MNKDQAEQGRTNSTRRREEHGGGEEVGGGTEIYGRARDTRAQDLGETDNPLQPREAVIENVHRENEDTFTLDLALRNGKVRRKYPFLPGQFNMLSLMGYEEAPISFASGPSSDGIFQHTVKTVGRLTQALSRLKTGDTIGIRGPYGIPWPVEELKGKDVLVVAGGIGIAPLRSLLHYVFQRRSDYGQVTIYYGAKRPRDVIYRNELDDWRSRPNTTLAVTVDRIDGDTWSNHVGVVPTLFEKEPVSSKNRLALVCGPEIMLKFVLIDLFKRGFPPEHIFVSMERRMRCGVAQCGHCMLGPRFVCRDGPVFRFTNIQHLFGRGV